MKHEHTFVPGKSGKVATCTCGAFRHLNLKPEDVIQIKMPSPLDPYRGTGPIAASLLTIDTDKLSAQWVRNFYQNNAMVSGYIEADESMGDAEFDQFVERFRTNHQGVSNAWHVAFLERAKFHETKYTQRDMQFQELRRLSRDEIFGVFGIHPAIMGISESVNRANAEAAEVHFARWLIKPRLERIRDALNEQILPHYGDNLEFDFEDPVPEDQDAKLRRVEVGYSTKTLTANERRAELGYPDADEEDADDLPQAQPSPFSLEAPRGTLKAADEQEIRPDEVNDEEELLDDVWERRLRAELDGLIEYLTPFFARRIRSAPYRVTTKIEISDVDGYDWNWSAKYGDDVIAELTKAFAAVLSSVSAEGVPVFPPPEVQRLARLYAVHRAGELLSVAGDLNIVFQTRQRVRDLVAENIRTGQSLNDLQAALRSDLSFSRARAERIARTETATALGQGQKQAAIAQGRDQKRWVIPG